MHNIVFNVQERYKVLLRHGADRGVLSDEKNAQLDDDLSSALETLRCALILPEFGGSSRRLLHSIVAYGYGIYLTFLMQATESRRNEALPRMNEILTKEFPRESPAGDAFAPADDSVLTGNPPSSAEQARLRADSDRRASRDDGLQKGASASLAISSTGGSCPSRICRQKNDAEAGSTVARRKRASFCTMKTTTRGAAAATETTAPRRRDATGLQRRRWPGCVRIVDA